MAFREMILKVFRGDEPGGVIWQPRIEFWFWVNQRRDTLPPQFKTATLEDVYDDLNASIRYFTNPIRVRYKNVKHNVYWADDVHLVQTWEAPIGSLREVLRFTHYNLSAYPEEYRVKDINDLKVLEFILQDVEYYFDEEALQRDLERVGDRGVPQCFFSRSPLQELIVTYMGFENAIYALRDYPKEMEHYFRIAEESLDRMLDVVIASPMPIFNFGENIDASLDPPSLFTKYHIPYYHKWNAKFKKVGKFTHIHMDGSLKPLLPYLKETHCDGIEAATPIPQGDVTIEELKEAMGNLVLLDGIPAILFLPHYPEEELIKTTERIIKLFYPRLILGVSDEPPPDTPYERLKLVSQIVERFNQSLKGG